ncbi:MAG TPA: RdgB/HAM1 family non-canonical purine NTP pyrophosphatase [Chthoniobacteraceae bacterium]|jgi:XTP/dITP diphosphohydrolase|nr:RdgB/HAM1 family non-canonical purine NTP pyrophosphatase [Chthoniobacteraceae bacterium]
MNLLIASRNAHKTAEIRAMLGAAWTVADLNAHPDLPSPEETGETFMANAEIKAAAAAERFAGLVLADDSGLEVDALGGAPGVRSARYAGEGATDAGNRAQLLRALTGATGPRTARFRCAMALARGGEIVGRFEGAVEGTLLEEERGAGGFGYDALFVPAGERETFAQLPAETKNRLSHRARALQQVIEFLRRDGASS